MTAIEIDYTVEGNSSDGVVEIYRSDASGKLGTLIATRDPSDPTVFVDEGLTEAKQFYYTIRRVTDHASTDSAQDAQYSKPLPPSGPSVDTITGDDVTFSWTDNASSEAGYRVLDSVDDGATWSQLGSDLAPDTTSTTVTLSRPNTHQLKARAFVGSGSNEAVADTSTIERTLVSSTTKTKTSGWTVEIDHPSGRTRRPTVIGTPQRNPVLNDQPTVTIPVERDDNWSDEAWTDAPMRVWRDGQRIPIEELQDVTHTPGETRLHGVGGIDLENRVETEYASKPVHEVVDELATNNTSLVVNVDDPTVSVDADQLVQSTQLSDFEQLVVGDYSEDPLDVTFDEVGLQQCGIHATESDIEGGVHGSDTDFGGCSHQHIKSAFANAGPGLTIQAPFTFDYTVPADRVGVAIHYESVGSGTVNGSYVRFAGDELAVWPTSADRFEGSWAIFDTTYAGGDLQAGTQYWFEFYNASSDIDMHVDDVYVYDTKYPPSGWDEPSGDVAGSIDAPETFPSSLTFEFSEVTPAVSVSGAKFDGAFDDVSGAQQIELSNDQGTSWMSASNTDTLEHDFESLGPTIQARVTLSRYGSGGQDVPTTGYLGQTISSEDLYADLDETPLVINQRYNRSLKSILRELADNADSLWEIQWDDASGSLALEWTQPGQRGGVNGIDVADYEVTKTTKSRPEQIIVKGSAIPFSEQFVANHDTAVDLNELRLVTGSETVYDPSNPGTQFERGADYELNHSDGKITTLSSGSMTDGTTFAIDYSRKAIGFETLPNATSPLRVEPGPFELPNITTDQEADIIARRIKAEISEPMFEVSATIPETVGYSLLEQLDFEDVPTDGPVTVLELEDEPGSTRGRFGSRESVGEIVADIRSKLSAVANRT